MNLFKTFVVLALIATSGDLSAELNVPQKDCDKVEVKVDTQQTTNGLDNGQAKVELIRGDANAVKYIFCQPDGRVLNEGQFDSNTIDGLKQGKYICIVSASGCSKKVNFTIK
jgi:hypothetical protein